MSKKRASLEMNFDELPPLPNGWLWGYIEDAASKERNAIVDGPFGSNLKLCDYIDPPGVPVLTTANLRGNYSPNSVRYISKEKFEQLKRSEVRGGDILVAKIGSCGLTGVYPDDMPSAIIPANLLKMTAHRDFNKNFILYYLGSPIFSTFLKTIITATAQPAFNVTKFRQLPFPIAPKDEQNQIVAEIEKQFTRLDAGVAALKRVQANLKRYRAAVLKAACEGKLVHTEAELHSGSGVPQLSNKENQSRDGSVTLGTYEPADQLLARILTERRKKWNGKGKYKEPAEADSSNLPELPEEWAWATVDELAAPEPNSITDGPFGSNLKTEHYTENGPRVIRLQNIGDGVYVDEEAHISLDHFKRLQKHRIFANDLVIAAFGASPPRSCIIPSTLGPAIVKADCIRFKPSACIATKYINTALNSDPVRKRAKGMVHGVGRPRLNLCEIKSIVLPIPPFAEQTRIADEVERRLSVVEELEAVVAANLQRANRLRQAILQKAFSGTS